MGCRTVTLPGGEIIFFAAYSAQLEPLGGLMRIDGLEKWVVVIHD